MGIFRFALASGDAKLVLTSVSIACAAEMAPTSESRRCSWWKNWRATGTHFKNHKYFESGGSSSLAGSHSSGLLVKGWICLIGTIAHLTARAVVSVGKRNCTSNTFSSWGTLWDAMAIAPLRLPRLGQGSWS